MMNKEYIKLRTFWNDYFKSINNSEEVLEKWINDENFNGTIKKYVKEGSKVLDFGCGNGWGLIEIAYTVNIKEGIGVDQSNYAVENANRTIEKSKINKIKFLVGDENNLDNYLDYFDVVFSVNTFDVIPNEALENVIISCKNVLKNNGYLLVTINPDFPRSFLEKVGYEVKDGYLYKDNILRGNYKTTDEWIECLSKYLTFVEIVTFALSDLEKTYPRRMLIFKKK